MDDIILRADGAARGNPGHAGIGGVLEDGNGVVLEEYSEYIGEATNNVAEYASVVYGLKQAKQYKCNTMKIVSDSELVIRQLRGEYKVKDAKLKQAYAAVLTELGMYERALFTHVPRDKNAIADELANRAIDDYMDGLKTDILFPELLWGDEQLF